jgi:hypothetical protein
MDNKDLIKQYVNTGAILTGHQIGSLNKNARLSYFRRRFQQIKASLYYRLYYIQDGEHPYLDDRALSLADSIFETIREVEVIGGFPKRFQQRLYLLKIKKHLEENNNLIYGSTPKFFDTEFFNEVADAVKSAGGTISLYGEVKENHEYLLTLFNKGVINSYDMFDAAVVLNDNNELTDEILSIAMNEASSYTIIKRINEGVLVDPNLIDRLANYYVEHESEGKYLVTSIFNEHLGYEFTEKLELFTDKILSKLFERGVFDYYSIKDFPEKYHLEGVKSLFNHHEDFDAFYLENMSKEAQIYGINRLYKDGSLYVEEDNVNLLNPENLRDYLQKESNRFSGVSKSIIDVLPKRGKNVYYKMLAEKGELDDKQYEDAPMTIRRIQLDVLYDKFDYLTPEEREDASEAQLKRMGYL